MPRALWKGAISFSLIHIPVQLFTATRANELDLNMLDKRDFSPIGYKRTNKKTGRTVEWNDIVKGYEYQKGKYVVLTSGDFRRANVEATQTIDIHAFTDRDAIAPYYFETPYYLAPDKGGAKVFRLLHDALTKSNKVGVASVVIRTRQHLAALMPLDDIIVLDTLRFAEEVLDAAKVVGGAGASASKAASARSAAASPREMQMALKLIEEMSEPWKPERYHDSYREDLMKRIEEKIRSRETHQLTEDVAPRRAEGGKVVDLMALLKRSLDEKQRGASRDRPSGRRSSYGRRRASRTRGRPTARRA